MAGHLGHVGSGKVREIFAADPDHLLLVTSDRISAYDVVMDQTIPDKGKVLTGLSHHWFTAFADVCPNHMVSIRVADFPDAGLDDLSGRSMLCRPAEPLPVEFVVRGFLSGSGWREYQAAGSVCGHRLPPGLIESDRLPEPLLTPATKAVTGHDENITEDQAADSVGRAHYEAAKAYAMELYRRGAEAAEQRGVILADTKFEFGLIDGEVVLIDEAMTPDSSRFWPQDRYHPGGTQPSFDKQYLRDWLDSTGWNHAPPPPQLPDDVVANTRSKYIEAFERLTGSSFDTWIELCSK